MSGIPSSQLYSFPYLIDQSNLDEAFTLLDEDEVTIDEIYDYENGKNCLHKILDNVPSIQTEKLLNLIIKDASSNYRDCKYKFEEDANSNYHNCKDKFEESKPFLYALKSKHKKHFKYLLKEGKELLKDQEVSLCFQKIVEKNLVNSCELFLKNLDQKHFQWITKPYNDKEISPLFKSVKKNRLKIFKTFIKYLNQIQLINKPFPIFEPLQNKENLLHWISKNQKDTSFFLELINTLFDEVIKHLNDQNELGKTPIYIASEEGNEKIVEELLKYGADYTIKSNENLYNEPYTSKKNSFDVAKNESIKKLFEKARFGLIPLSEKIPINKEKIKKQREENLLDSIKLNKIEYAKSLIKDYNVDPSITDKNQNSLAMMALKNLTPRDCQEFIDFLVSNKKINFKHSNKQNDNLLTASLSLKNPALANYLLKKYPKEFDFDHANTKGQTALLLAMGKDDKSIIKELLKDSQKIDLNKNEQGKKALDSLITDYEKQISELREQKEKIQKAFEKDKSKLIESHKKELEKQKEFYRNF